MLTGFLFCASVRAAKKLGPDDSPPRPLVPAAPVYPAGFREQRLIGNAEIVCTIDEEGRATQLAVGYASLPEFGTAAMEALARSTFKPAIVAGRPAAVRVNIPFEFDMGADAEPGAGPNSPPEALLPGLATIPAVEADAFPELIKEIRPQTPGELVRARKFATVVASLVVDEHGLPRDIRLISSTFPGCGPEALRVIREWKFVPSKKDGQPVRVALEVLFGFFPENTKASGLRLRPGVSRNFVKKIKGEEVIVPTGPGARFTPPVVLQRVLPEYPDEMLDRIKNGDVEFELIISPQGVVTHVRALRMSNPIFSAMAEKAVSYWKFSPGKIEGRPVYCRIRQAVIFQITWN